MINLTIADLDRMASPITEHLKRSSGIVFVGAGHSFFNQQKQRKNICLFESRFIVMPLGNILEPAVEFLFNSLIPPNMKPHQTGKQEIAVLTFEPEDQVRWAHEFQEIVFSEKHLCVSQKAFWLNPLIEETAVLSDETTDPNIEILDVCEYYGRQRIELYTNEKLVEFFLKRGVISRNRGVKMGSGASNNRDLRQIKKILKAK
jgi:hypothetical protein